MRYVTDLKVTLKQEVDAEWDELGRKLSLRAAHPGTLISALRELQSEVETEIVELLAAQPPPRVAADG